MSISKGLLTPLGVSGLLWAFLDAFVYLETLLCFFAEEQMNGRTGGPTDGRAGGRTDGRTSGRADGRAGVPRLAKHCKERPCSLLTNAAQ